LKRIQKDQEKRVEDLVTRLKACEWENLQLDEVTYDEPDEAEFDVEDLGEQLEALPRSVEDVS
jgi:hypothetical protein